MKHLLCYLLTSLLGISILMADVTTSQDSLLRIVKDTTDPSRQIAAYRNLADLYFEKPEEFSYLKQMYRAAESAGNKEEMYNALLDLTFSYIKVYKIDSAKHCMKEIEALGKPEETIPYLSYLRMRMFEGRIRKNDSEKAIEEELYFLDNSRLGKNNIYIQVEQAYTTGFALFNKDKYQEAYPYMERAYKLAAQLPRNEGRKINNFITWDYFHLLNFLDRGQESIAGVEKILERCKVEYDQCYARQRPFYNMNARYLQCYTALLMRSDLLPEDKIDYYVKLVEKMKTQVTENIDKYNCFLSMNNYYLHKKDYANALMSNDSLIKYARLITPCNVPGLLEINSQIYEAMGNYKEAFRYHKFYTEAQDSINSAEMQKQLSELQVKYEIDKLNYENSHLADKNRQILLITLASVLFLVIGVCIYLYYDLKRERRMKKKLGELNEKADESEKLKTAFINSMCHEIRTPLNAIVGFSGIITDDMINGDEAMKKEYYNLITVNAQTLTSLIDHLLVVANLDSSDGLLPCERVNIKSICMQEMEKVKRQAKPEITYQLDLPEEEIFISTNEEYLSLVIENLLNNANKFTEKGNISLGIWLDKAQGRLQISVKDTGCGIPVEKQEVVFQRFSKLDEYVQGNGLGLYLSRLIVTRLSGTILVDSSYKDGARLVINIPV